jgi:hypothetical protein
MFLEACLAFAAFPWPHDEFREDAPGVKPI